jgi:UDP-N-acetyl-D-mannosaminuronic acid dehydrogenase
MQNTTVNVVGLGYIGLPTALMMAAHGVKVVGTDYNADLVQSLCHDRLTFQEDGLAELFAKAKENGITFTTEYQKTSMYVVAVATPYEKDNKQIDPRYVVSAVKNVLDVCEKGAIIAIESTVSPGTIDRYVRPLLAERGLTAGVDVHLVHTPERIIPGNMVYELEHNSRTIGADDPEIGQQVKALYKTFCQGDIEVTDIRTAEMTKVVENTYRDINIAFANELAKICHSDGMDVHEIIRIANKHPRVNILSPGPGVGGHCISVDPWFLVGDYPDLANIIRQAREINDSMPEYVLNRVREIMEENGVEDFSRVGFYGVTYKENVDDVRESPTLQLAEKMKEGQVQDPKYFDPMVEREVLPGQCQDFESFLQDIDVMVVMIPHAHLFEHFEQVREKKILDTRNCAIQWPESNLAYSL